MIAIVVSFIYKAIHINSDKKKYSQDISNFSVACVIYCFA